MQRVQPSVLVACSSAGARASSGTCRAASCRTSLLHSCSTQRIRGAYCTERPVLSLEHVRAASLGLVAGLALPDADHLALHGKLRQQGWTGTGRVSRL